MGVAQVQLKNINKTYNDEIRAIKNFNLDIKDKEFVVLVGPSGCGKSTILRLIAGLEEATSGEIYIDGKLINKELPRDRNLAFVFQNYALYPHLNIYNNIAFGLKSRKYPKDKIESRVREVASLLNLTEHLERKPHELSGGQQQRVALGRAIVRNANLFLMDEPLSNLDAKLRTQMRTELTKLHKELQTTTVYVTHDQVEALTMASRLVVMNEGEIQQIGHPQDVYNNPESVFVGSFIGSPPMNFITCKVGKSRLEVGNTAITIPQELLQQLHKNNYIDKEVIIGIRPEHIYDANNIANLTEKIILESEIELVESLGSENIVHTRLENNKISLKLNRQTTVDEGRPFRFAIDINKIHFFDYESEKRLNIH